MYPWRRKLRRTNTRLRRIRDQAAAVTPVAPATVEAPANAIAVSEAETARVEAEKADDFEPADWEGEDTGDVERQAEPESSSYLEWMGLRQK